MTKERMKRVSAVDWVGQPPVRVRIPMSVAYDLERFQQAHASILDRLGCPECSSGADIRFDIVRSFNVNDKLKVRELADEMLGDD